MLPPPPPPEALAQSKSKSFDKKGKAKENQHSRSTSASYSGSKKEAFKAPEPVKVARPEDYNEIQFKAADPFALRRAQKQKGSKNCIRCIHTYMHIIYTKTGRYARRNLTANASPNQPTTRTRPSSVGSKPLKEKKNNVNRSSAPWMKKQQQQNAAKPPPVPANAVKKKAPSIPSSGPPPPKMKPRGIEKKGVLEALPTSASDGWIFNQGGMYKVEYKKCHQQIASMNIFEGSPVMFQCVEKNVSNIRLNTKLDESTVKVE